MALACDQVPDHSTIAAFISSMKEEIQPLFRDVLLVGKEMVYGKGIPVSEQQEETTMDKPEPDLHFKFMSLGYKFRDLFLPRMNILKEVGIRPGFHVLDYGCGPGSYVFATAELVGKSGRIYALDIHPLAIDKVRNIVSKRQLTNVETICSDCETGLPDNSLDVVLLYDAFHTLGDPDGVLEELHRVLKPKGILSFSDHHLKENETLSKITNRGLFRLSRKGKRTYSFAKEE